MLLTVSMLLSNYIFMRMNIFGDKFSSYLNYSDDKLLSNKIILSHLILNELTEYIAVNDIKKNIDKPFTYSNQEQIIFIIVKSIANKEKIFNNIEFNDLIVQFKEQNEVDDFYILKNFNYYSYLALYLKAFYTDKDYLDFINFFREITYCLKHNEQITVSKFYMNVYMDLIDNNFDYLKLSQLTLLYNKIPKVKSEYNKFKMNIKKL